MRAPVSASARPSTNALTTARPIEPYLPRAGRSVLDSLLFLLRDRVALRDLDLRFAFVVGDLAVNGNRLAIEGGEVTDVLGLFGPHDDGEGLLGVAAIEIDENHPGRRGADAIDLAG